jgi:cytochrome P450
MTSAAPVFTDDPYSDENLADPYPLFARMQAAGPVVWLEQYGVYAFTGFEQCREILTDWRTFISGAGVGPKNLHHEKAWRQQGILEADPPIHSSMRGAMTTVIAPRNVRVLRAGFEKFAVELVDQLLATPNVDLVQDFAEIYPIRAFGDAVGIPREGRAENLLPLGAMNFSAFGPDNARARDYFAKGAGTHEWAMANCARENLTVGGIGALLWAEADAGAITADEATLLVRATLSAGLDTTIIAIGNTLMSLASTPGQWEALHANPSLTKFAADEALRYESPFQSFFRTVSSDTTFQGIELPAGSKVLLFIGAANRDESQWGPTANEYELTRKAGGHLAFGMGIHQCVGQPISRLEIEVVISELARRVKTIELGGATAYLHNTLKGWSSIPAVLTTA